MISDLNGSLGSRQFLNVANERTCFASSACTFKSTGLFTPFIFHQTHTRLERKVAKRFYQYRDQ